MLRRIVPAAAAVAVGLSALPSGTAAAAPPTPADQTDQLVQQLLSETGGSARLATSRATGLVRFLGTQPDAPVPAARGLSAGASPEQAARGFLAEHGALFGIADAGAELALVRQDAAAAGGSLVRFQQLQRGLPVVAGQLVVEVAAGGATRAVSGETAPTLPVATAPRLTAPEAAGAARTAVAKWHGLPAGALAAAAPELAVYDPGLVGASGPRVPALVWSTEVRSADRAVRELVLVDAVRGSVALHVDRNPEAEQRYVCNNKNVRKADDSCTGNYARVEGGPKTGVADVDLAYDFSGITYDFYKSRFNRDSLDGKGKALRSTVKYCTADTSYDCPFANAYWNGEQMVYGDGYASADDVVGHELTHAVTEFTNDLYYYMQSGAINESMSDIFGELIDLTDGRGTDTAAARWLVGEDLPIGAIRDMLHPEDFSEPDRMTSSDYDTGLDDSGGVHSNSGVGNKAAAMIVDGGSFNGRTITGIGTTKAARVYYRAQLLLTSGSDYADLYDVLQQACTGLVGSGITAADCTSVTKAVQATEMDKQPSGAEAPEAAFCPTGQTRSTLFADDLENPSSGSWVKAKKSAAPAYFGWAYPQNANGYGGAIDVTYAHSGKTHFWGDDLGDPADGSGADKAGSATITKAKAVPLPAGKKAYLHFAHAFGFESDFFSDYDGGRVEYSTDNGATWKDAGALPAVNGYTSSGIGAFGGKPGFGGASQGYISTRFELSSLAGKSVKVRFAMANDQYVGDYGWFVDDITLYTCGT